MSELPKSPTREAQEAIATRLDEIVRGYDPQANIVLRAWQNDIETKVASALASMKTFIFVHPISYDPVDKFAGADMRAKMEVSVRSNGALKGADPSRAEWWDVEDLASVLVNDINGNAYTDNQSVYREITVTGYKANMAGLKKAVNLTLEFEINP